MQQYLPLTETKLGRKVRQRRLRVDCPGFCPKRPKARVAPDWQLESSRVWLGIARSPEQQPWASLGEEIRTRGQYRAQGVKRKTSGFSVSFVAHGWRRKPLQEFFAALCLPFGFISSFEVQVSLPWNRCQARAHYPFSAPGPLTEPTPTAHSCLGLPIILAHFLLLQKRPWPNVTWWGKGSICLTFPHHSASRRETSTGVQGGTPESGAEANMEERCSLAFYSWLTVCFLV